jgi:hypothetical protein
MSELSSQSRGFVRRHWKAYSIIGTAVGAIVAWGVYVFLWFVGNAQSSSLVPRELGLWTTSNLVAFIVNGAFWELLLVGAPAILAAGVGWTWLSRLPEEERRVRHFRNRSSGGGLSLFFFVAFCIKVFLDGNWNIPIASFTLDYVIGSLLVIAEWSLIIFRIPAALWLAWRIGRHQVKT